MSLSPDRHPLLATRAYPKPDIQQSFNAWQVDKHIPEIMSAPGPKLAVYALSVLDAIPAVYQGSSWCLAYYTASTKAELLAFLGSDELKDAVADGRRWFGQFNDVDQQAYTGNVYEVFHVVNPSDTAPPPESAMLLQRFEVPAERYADFDSWATDVHMPALGQQPGVLRVRLLGAERRGVPIGFYLSAGTRALMLELDPEAFQVLLSGEGMLNLMADSQRWDRELTYVKREVYRHHAHLRSQ